MALTISSTASVLNRFCVTHDNEIHTELRQRMVTENIWAPVSTNYAYAAKQLDFGGDLIQAMQCDFTPQTGTGEFSELLWVLKPLKIDIEFSCDDLDMWFDKFMCDFHQFGSGRSLTEWDYPRWLVNNHIIPRVANDMELKVAYKASYVAPTTGTPGTTLQSVNGMAKVLADAITALKIPAANVITTGVITSSTAVDKLEAFVDALPELARQQGGVIYCSEAVQRLFVRDMLEHYGAGCCETSPIGNPMLAERIKGTPIFNSSIKLVGLPSMAGSNRLIYEAMPGNLIWGRRTGEPMLPTIRWEEDKRTLVGMAEFHRFYGFRNGRLLFVNEQA